MDRELWRVTMMSIVRRVVDCSLARIETSHRVVSLSCTNFIVILNDRPSLLVFLNIFEKI